MWTQEEYIWIANTVFNLLQSSKLVVICSRLYVNCLSWRGSKVWQKFDQHSSVSSYSRYHTILLGIIIHTWVDAFYCGVRRWKWHTAGWKSFPYFLPTRPLQRACVYVLDERKLFQTKAWQRLSACIAFLQYISPLRLSLSLFLFCFCLKSCHSLVITDYQLVRPRFVCLYNQLSPQLSP